MNENLNPQSQEVDEFDLEDFDGEEETLAEYHRLAAHHYSLASKHHRFAADAEDTLNVEAMNTHTFLAYRHKLMADQYAEQAVLNSLDLDGEDEEEGQ